LRVSIRWEAIECPYKTALPTLDFPGFNGRPFEV
jgi:hypothetical protein